MSDRARATGQRRILGPAIVLGIGLGGLFDGILLHQVLQWHHMLSAPVPPTSVAALERNTLADGLFHVAAWLITVAGVVWLARRRDGLPDLESLVGGLLVGWGGFNTVEGLVDHYLLGIHHVRAGPDAWAYDLGALVLSVMLVALGAALLRRPATRRR